MVYSAMAYRLDVVDKYSHTSAYTYPALYRTSLKEFIVQYNSSNKIST